MPKFVEELDQSFNRSRVFFDTAKNLTEVEDPVFTLTELEVLEKLIQTTEEWWTEKQELYLKQTKSEDPIVTTQDIKEKVEHSSLSLSCVFLPFSMTDDLFCRAVTWTEKCDIS